MRRKLRIKDVVEGIFDGPHATPTKTEEGPYFLGISSLRDGRLELSKSAHLSHEDFARWTRRVTPQADDLVFSYETRLGQAALIPEGLECCLGRRMGLLRPDREVVNPRYLLYLYLGPDFQRTLLERSVSGSTVDRILLTELPEFPVEVHKSMEDQQRIARLLGALDDRIELNRKMIQALESISFGLYRSCFLGGTNGSSETLGTTSLQEEFALEMGVSPPGPSYNQDGVGLPFYQGATDLQFRVPALRVYCRQPKRTAAAGDTLVSVRAPVGRVNLAERECCIGRGVAALRHKSGSVAYTYYSAKQLEERFENFNAEGTVFGSISKRDFLALSVVAPPLELVDQFTETTAPLEDRILLNIRQNRILAQIRDTLLPKLISGEIQVPDAEKMVEEVA